MGWLNFSPLRWLRIVGVACSVLVSGMVSLAVQPGVVSAAQIATQLPAIAAPSNQYSNALVTSKLARLHATPKARASAGYLSSTSWPVLFVHGFNRAGAVDCNQSYWASPIGYLRHAKWRGPLLTLGFYNGDTGCDAYLSSEAQNCITESIGNEGTTNEDLRHLACELAWYIWDHYSQYGQSVQVVAHSMGGLLIRAALAATTNNFWFPPYLYVQDVVTISTPMGGIPSSGTVLAACGGCLQTQEMHSDDPFIQNLTNDGQNPQGAGWGTDWTLLGSSCESFYRYDNPGVYWQSALAMTSNHKTEYLDPPCYDHGAYLDDWVVPATAHARVGNATASDGLTYTSFTWPHALQNMVLALEYRTW